MSLTKDFLDEWVKALRSGDYKQAPGALKVDIGGEMRHCCLGVACELMGVEWEHLEKTAYEEEEEVNTEALLALGEPYSLFRIHVEDRGEKDHQGSGMPTDDSPLNRGDIYSLAQINDVGGSFELLADIIEQHAEEILLNNNTDPTSRYSLGLKIKKAARKHENATINLQKLGEFL